MKTKFATLVAALLLIVPGCRRPEPGTEIGAVYARIARPAVWRVLARSQADSLGLLPGDLIVSYNGEPVQSVDDLVHRQTQAAEAGRRVPLTILREEAEVELTAGPGQLGILPDAARYTSSLAIALEDILSHHGSIADYAWLAAATGEAFAFTAEPGACAMGWPGAFADEYLESLKPLFGLSFDPVYGADPVTDTLLDQPQPAAVARVRAELDRGRTVLLLADWPDGRINQWGIAVRYDDADSALYGYTIGSAAPVPITGFIDQAFNVRYAPVPEVDPGDLLGVALDHALELGQTYNDSGPQSGIAAYDVWIAALDSVPFCATCGSASQACFDGVVWSLIANKQTADEFLADVRDALPEQADFIDQIRSDNGVILARLDGIINSRTPVGTVENQRKLARAVGEIQIIETDLLQLYEELLSEL